MKNNKILYLILVFIITLFSFNLDVDAAQELVCVYNGGFNGLRIVDKGSNGYKLTQDSEGNLKFYVLGHNTASNDWIEVSKLVNGNDIKLKFESDSLSSCPAYFYQDLDDNLNFVNTASWKYAKSILKASDTNIENGTYKELTCLYEKKGEKNERNIKKVVLTQDKNGVIFVYKNKEDVGLTGHSSYWISYQGEEYIFDDDSLKFDANGGLLECPQSKTTLKFPQTGGVEFFGDNSGEDMLEQNYDGVQNILTTAAKTGGAPDYSVGFGQTCDSINDNDKWLTDLGSEFTGSCLYQYDTEYGCHIIELNMSSTYVNVVDSFVNQNFGEREYYYSNVDYDTFSISHIKNTAESLGCPPVLSASIYKFSYPDGLGYYGSTSHTANIGYGLKNGNLYGIVAVRGYNAFTGEKLKLADLELKFNVISDFEDCEDLFNGNEGFLKTLSTIITIIKIAIPIILFVMGALDFAQAIFSGNEDGMKKAQSKFIKRIIIAVCIFLIPSVLKLVLTIANGVWGGISTDLCGLL